MPPGAKDLGSHVEAVRVQYLGDVNLRAVLNVLIVRAGGTIGNAELDDAMLPDRGQADRFHVEEMPDRLRLTLAPRSNPACPTNDQRPSSWRRPAPAFSPDRPDPLHRSDTTGPPHAAGTG